MPPPTENQTAQPALHRAVNRGALVVAVFLVSIGILRLVVTLFSTETLPLRPVDGWLLMSLRMVAVLFSLGMLLLSDLRQRYFFLLLALALLTSAGLGQRLGSLLPGSWQPTAGVAQLLLSVLGLASAIAGLAQGENLVALIQEAWGITVRASPPDTSIDKH